MPNPDVGKLYEVAINDVGYMMADTIEDQNLQYRRITATLEPQRFADGATPFSEAIERYSFINSSEWRGGAGQRFANRNQSDLSSYWDSLGVDPFDEDQRLKLLPLANLAVTDTDVGLHAVAGSNYLLYRASATAAATYSISGDTATSEDSYTGYGAVTDLDIGFGKGFIATGTNLEQVTLGAAGDTELSTLDIHRVAWIGDRLAVLYRDSATSTWRFSTLDTSGTEEIPGGLLTLPGATNASHASCEYQLGGIAPGQGFTWFSGWAADGDEAHIYVWGNDTTLSASIALVMPRGEVPLDIFFYQGGVYIYAVSPSRDQAKIYRCVVNGDGTLTPFLVVEDAGSAPSNLERLGCKFAADGRNVFFAWNDMVSAGNSGIGVIDLATGGYAKRTQALATGDVNSVYVWGNRPGMSVTGRGLYREHSTNLVSTGWLRTSIFDADSAIPKQWDALAYSVDEVANGTIDVAYTIDGGSTYTTLIDDAADGDGEVELAVKAPTLGLEITLDGNGSVTPEVRVVSAKFHPLGVIDEMLVFPLDCSDKVEGLNGAPLPYVKDSGRARAAALRRLQGNYVSVQDVDWPETDEILTMEVMQVDVRSAKFALDPATRTNRSSQVAVVTLRSTRPTSTIAALASNNAPVVSNPGTQSDSAASAVTPVQLAATDADSDALTWGARGLPTGLSCDSNGLISGTPTETGAFSVTVFAYDGTAMGEATFTWNIT